MDGTRQQHRGWQRAAIGIAAGASLHSIAAPTVLADDEAVARGGRPFAPVVEDIVRGDLLLVGNSNLLSAGGWRSPALTAADVDGDVTTICTARRAPEAGDGSVLAVPVRRLCSDNSSSADLDLPPGARVIAARLYAETAVGRDVGPLRVALDGPGAGYSYETLPADPPADGDGRSGTPTKLYEASGDRGDGAVLRQAVWDVAGYVAAAGPGTYTVADLVNERVGPWLPYASWAIVVAYELDPTVGLEDVAVGDRSRFATRLLSWHDGFQHLETGSLDVAIGGLDLEPGAATFAKSFHVVARGRSGRSDNLLFGGGPLGNNNTPGDSSPPPGVALGTDPSCNTVTDVQNDSICVLGASVGTKTPGADAFRSSADGTTPSSGSGVDIDVIRIPDRYLRAAGTETLMRVQVTGRDTVAPGMLAVSIDVPGGEP